MGQASELLSNPQASERHFRNALSVIDGCSGEQRLNRDYALGKLLLFARCITAMLVTVNSYSILEYSLFSPYAEQSKNCF